MNVQMFTERSEYPESEGSPIPSARVRDAHCKRIAFVTVALSGHMRPAVSLATEMVDRGFVVDFIVGANGIKDQLLDLERKNELLTVHGLTKGVDLIDNVSWGEIAASTGRLAGSRLRLFEEIVRATSNNLDARVERVREAIGVLEQVRPDVVILDHSQMIVQEWAQLQGIATVIMHTPYFLTGSPTGCARLDDEEQNKLTAFFEKVNPMGAMLAVRSALGIAPENEAGSENGATAIPEGAANAPAAQGLAPHTFVFCEPELLHEAHVPARVHVVGPCLARNTDTVDDQILPWLNDAATLKQPVLYVAFGTLANGFLTRAAIRILLGSFSVLAEAGNWRILWSLPELQQRHIDEADIPPCVRVETFVRQRAVLSHPAVQLFLTHGGQSSVNEGVAAGLPLVCMPLFCDQYELAESVYRHGLGLVFHKDELRDGNTSKLVSMLQSVAIEPRFRAMAKRHSQLMKIRAGCGRAAEVIESIAFVGADYQELWCGLPASPSEIHLCVEEGGQCSPASSLPRCGGA